MSPSPRPTVLVVGAGPAGLTAALSLRKNGVSVRIIDKSSEHQSGTRGPGLSPRTLELWKLLGVLPDILAKGTPPLPRRVYSGKTIVRTWDVMPSVPATPDVPYPNPLVNSQSITCAILRDHLARYDVSVELSTELSTFKQDEDGVSATITRTNEAGETEEEVVQCEYLIGTDGAKGVTRKLLDIPFLGETMDDQVVVSDVIVEGIDRDHWHMFGDPTKKMINLLPMVSYPDGTLVFNVVCAGRELDIPALLSGGVEEYRKLFNELVQNEDFKLVDVKWISSFRPNIRCAEKFSEGRVFMAGDVAHVHSPAGGQGLNTSVQDAHNVAWKIALVSKGLSSSSLLDSINIERLPVVKTMLKVSTGLHKAQLPAGVPPTSANSDASKFEASKALQKGPQGPHLAGVSASASPNQGRFQPRPLNMKQLGVNYRWSPFVLDERYPNPTSEEIDELMESAYGPENEQQEKDRFVRAGDRAPDAPVSILSSSDVEKTTLFETFKATKHTALVFLSDFDGHETKEAQTQVQDILSILRRHGETIDSFIVLPPSGEEPKTSTSSSTFIGPNGAKVPTQTLIDSESFARKAYGIDRVTETTKTKAVVVVVRPDGVVGAFALGPDYVAKYCEKVFIK